MGSPWWKGIALFLSWRIRMLPALSQEAPEELHALWPADPAEHCRLCLSYLKQMPVSYTHLAAKEYSPVPYSPLQELSENTARPP